jgi:hypothetical protein
MKKGVELGNVKTLQKKHPSTKFPLQTFASTHLCSSPGFRTSATVKCRSAFTGNTSKCQGTHQCDAGHASSSPWSWLVGGTCTEREAQFGAQAS